MSDGREDLYQQDELEKMVDIKYSLRGFGSVEGDW